MGPSGQDRVKVLLALLHDCLRLVEMGFTDLARGAQRSGTEALPGRTL